MSGGMASTPFEERVALACWAAVPVVVILGVVAMLMQPEVFAETETTDGTTPWGGAIAGLSAFLLFTAAPLAFFGHALRAGTRRLLTITIIAAAILALYGGLIPLLGALVGGWEGVSALAVLTGAAVGVLEGFVVVAAVGARRRLGPERSAPAA